MSKEEARPSKILIVADGTQADKSVTKLASKIALRNKGDIFAIYVIEVKRTLPLETEIETEIQKGENVLEQVEKSAKIFGHSITETALLQTRDKGSAIVEESRARSVDLIILGINYEKPFGEFSLGTAIPYVLKHAVCSVILVREPMPREQVINVNKEDMS